MQLAGWLEAKSASSGNAADLPAPTLAEAGIDKRPRKRDELSSDPDDGDTDDEADQ